MGLEDQVDIYKDTNIRYLGYANELGEAFRHIIGNKWVNVSYGIATLYVFADTIDKTFKSYEENKTKPSLSSKVFYTGVDTLTWQMLASVVIPGYTINRLCYFTTFALKKNKIPSNVTKVIVPAIALCSIPFIVKPIDHFSDLLLDYTLRRFKP